ncbi:MAG TPA: 3-methylitaconate isomerase, partial [Peptococcaceae bacterium]|nr:3-methylitaconate isomerase [Peptococcaceae bacterium]
MSDLFRVPCVVMRGGTSRAVFIKENDLPSDKTLRDQTILSIFGSPDVRQIDGIAGADPLTSKLAIIGPPSRPDADVDYTFGQVSITDAYIDYSGNCGNISSGVGPFAIDESMVRATEPVTMV